MKQVSRRSALKYFGLAALGVLVWPANSAARKLTSTGKVLPTGIEPTGDSSPQACQEHPVWQLLAPLQEGSNVAGLTLASTNWNVGSVDVKLEKPDLSGFSVRICSKDSGIGGPMPIARTRHHDLYLINGGNGKTGTDEQEGLAVIALGNVVSRNECRTGCVATETIRERWLTHGAEQPQGAS